MKTLNIRNMQIALPGIWFGGFLAGAAVAYLGISEAYERKLEGKIAEAVDDAKAFYSAKYKTDEFATPEKAAEALGVDIEEELIELKGVDFDGETVVELNEDVVAEVPQEIQELMTNYSGVSKDIPPQPQRGNIFVDGKPLKPEDYDIPDDPGEAVRPYIVDEDDFYEGKEGYKSYDFTYFERDGVLVDEADNVIENVDDRVGELNLQQFGHLSNDKDTVFVRNDKRKEEYEIVREKRSYSGAADNVIRHSADRRIQPRFRNRDD